MSAVDPTDPTGPTGPTGLTGLTDPAMANPPRELLQRYVLRQGDRSLILAQRLAQWLTRAHELEEEMALGNIALDLLGQTRALYTYAGQLDLPAPTAAHLAAGPCTVSDEAAERSTNGTVGAVGPRTEDDFAYYRSDREFQNPLLVEQPNGDFAVTMVRQLFHDAWAAPFWDLLRSSTDATLAALAGKAVKETAYHLRHARSWVIRLGDGTDESHQRTQRAVDQLWKYTGEMFESDEVEHALVPAGVAVDPSELEQRWSTTVTTALTEATLSIPGGTDPAGASPGGIVMQTGGRQGLHGEDFSYLIGELQVVARAHPGATW